MKFLVDMPLSPTVAGWLRVNGHDAVHAGEVMMHLWSDRAILDAALLDRRVIVTADLDFPRLLVQLGSSGPGLILVRGGNYSEIESLDCIRRVLLAIKEDDLPRSVIVVDHDKIRRRWLPI